MYHYTVNEDQKILFTARKEGVTLTNDGFVSVFYISSDDYDCLIKHGNKDVVLQYYNQYKEIFEEKPITKELGTLEYIEVPLKYVDLINICVNTSATKKLTKLKAIIENNDLNIIDVEVYDLVN